MSRVSALRRSRRVQGGIVWILGLVMTGLGGAYAIFGARATASSRAFETLTHFLPWHMHGYGALIGFGGLALLEGVAPTLHREPMRDDHLHAVLAGTVVLNFGVAGMFGAAWYLTGIPTYGSILVWLGFCALAAVAWAWPPDPADARAP